MLKKLSIAAAGSAIATLTAVSGANAVSFTGTGDGLVELSFDSSSIVVTDDILIEDISIDLNGMDFTWIGELDVDLVFDDGAGNIISVDVLNNGNAGGVLDLDDVAFGDYTFVDGAPPVVNTGDFLPTGSYAPTESFLDAFGGLNAKGTWTLEFRDSFAIDGGTMDSWDINIVSTPEPASLLALFGIGVLGATSLKRKQKEKV
ncbi:PEP-CTERM sorting domain-containing protein [Okeania sp. SIO2B9]|uniref:PEP-CTERM sorting domain-containing protein n=1 Tax=Okeania sp. SIO2B9 TaxID=2607782 RepID=UPI00142C42EE|nr:PEP-CTERM sorting domain-containing protein [Okeania sp. SIO2B9]NES89801.1 PEP-CTERM sorting domain-containing protein [Okeania sp. SIO2B9]